MSQDDAPVALVVDRVEGDTMVLVRAAGQEVRPGIWSIDLPHALFPTAYEGDLIRLVLEPKPRG